MPRFQTLFLSMAFILCAASTVRTQIANDLDSNARIRIEQARGSIVVVSAQNDSGQSVPTAAGFFIRKDLVATDKGVVGSGSQVRVTLAGKDVALKVVKRGNYFLPFIELAMTAEMSPLQLGNSDKIAVNDRVYMFANPTGALSAGKVVGIGAVNNSPVFLITLPVNTSNRGGPVFNGNGEVIGIAAENDDGRSQGLAFPSSLLARLTQLGEAGGGMGPALPSLGPGSGPGIGSTSGDQKSLPTGTAVDTKPVLLSRVAPRYTEEARNNKIQGQVTVRALVGEDGEVKQLRIIRGLPDGLNEEAISAVRKSKFRPAMKDGKPVEFWVTLQLEFNLR